MKSALDQIKQKIQAKKSISVEEISEFLEHSRDIISVWLDKKVFLYFIYLPIYK